MSNSRDQLGIFEKLSNRKKILRLEQQLQRVRDYESRLRNRNDLVSQTEFLKKRIRDGATLDDILVEAFATASEAARRIRGEEAYNSQVVGGMVLHEGAVAEMRAGEGKTLTAVLPAYLNALAGSVHIATQNDYLTQRDRDNMGPIFDILGMNCREITSDMEREKRKISYQGDVVYATNHELVFDYLSDFMIYPGEAKIFPGFHFVIVDEVDSILIDEARTPLIVSEPQEVTQEKLLAYAKIASKMEEGKDFVVDRRLKVVYISPSGFSHASEELKKIDPETVHADVLYFLDKALKAQLLFEKGRDYVVQDTAIILVDEFTGRGMPDRRFMDGIHQAIEAKEGVPMRPEDRILASMTYQNFFVKYGKLAGITGTIFPEDRELKEIFHVPSIVVPPNMPTIREDLSNRYFLSQKDKLEYLVRTAWQYAYRGRPVLIATISVKDSEEISQYLHLMKFDHQLLNATHTANETDVVKRAGEPGVITVATNIAGRGTDIILSREAKNAGGLAVLATQMNQSRRIDNQLRGRAGRQGQKGTSQFLLSLEDEIIQVFATEEEKKKMQKEIGDAPGGIESRTLDRIFHKAQRQIEKQDSDIRHLYHGFHTLLERQRQTIVDKREFIFDHPHMLTELHFLIEEEMKFLVEYFHERLKEKNADQDKIWNEFLVTLSMLLPEDAKLQISSRKASKDLAQNLTNMTWQYIQKLAAHIHSQEEETVFRIALLEALDERWSAHLEFAELLQDHISIQSLTHADPLKRYRGKLQEHFEIMLIETRALALRGFVQALVSGGYAKILEKYMVYAA